MKDSLDKYWLGIAVGLVVPLLFGYSVMTQNGLLSIFHHWTNYPEVCRSTFAKLCQVAFFPDAAMVFLFYTMDMWKFSKGLVIGLIPYILIALILTT